MLLLLLLLLSFYLRLNIIFLKLHTKHIYNYNIQYRQIDFFLCFCSTFLQF